MASAVPNVHKYRLYAAWLAAADVRARLVMSNTTCDTEVDVSAISDYSTVDPCDATGYADIALAGEAVSQDDANDRGEYDANDAVFSGLSGDASRSIVGVLLYEYVDGTDANDIPGPYIEFSTPIPATATQVTIPWDAEGIAQAT